jgi:hypothetical protein
VGKDGVVALEEAKGKETSLKVVEGMVQATTYLGMKDDLCGSGVLD